MNAVTLSPKFQVVIPKAIRDKLRLKPGQKIQAIVYQNRIELILDFPWFSRHLIGYN